MATLIIDNFLGSMTRFKDGDINSGRSDLTQSFGYDSFEKPGNLTWNENAIQIDAAGAVITDLIMCGKERVESGVLFVYAVGHTGRVYKIQVNDPVTFNPDYDNPVLLTTLTIESPTFTRGGFIDFFGASEKLYIGHDKGVTTVDFNGSNETFVGVAGSWTVSVPRPLKQFVGKLYIGNGDNIAEIDSTATVTSYDKLTPGFPAGTQVRDMDVSVDGNYLHVVVSRLALADMTSGAQDTSISSISDSYIFKWNGTDVGYTAFDTFPSVNLTTNIIFGNYQYVFGYDLRGVAFFNPVDRLTSGGGSEGAPFVETPMPNAVLSDGGMVGFATPLFFDGHTELSYCIFGPYDWEIGTGYWSPFGMTATAPETDVVRCPYWQAVSCAGNGLSSNGYPDQRFGTSKVYFSTLETSSAPTTKYRFYKWSVVPTGSGSAFTEGVYQSQTQIFSKKVKISAVRIYGEPWVADNGFTIDLVGSSGGPIAGCSKTLTASLTDGDGLMKIGNDFAWYTPQGAPTYAVALRVTNTSSVNHTITKVEIDYDLGGQ